MGNLPPRKPAAINVSPVGNQGNKPQSGVLPSKRSAAPFGSVDKSVYTRRPSGANPMAQPINDKDAGKGTGNLRNAPQKHQNGIFRMPNGTLSAD